MLQFPESELRGHELSHVSLSLASGLQEDLNRAERLLSWRRRTAIRVPMSSTASSDRQGHASSLRWNLWTTGTRMITSRMHKRFLTRVLQTGVLMLQEALAEPMAAVG